MIDRIDHFVLTVASLETTCAFYERILGFVRKEVTGKPTALTFGDQKINVHQTDHTFEPKAAHPTPGVADFCLTSKRSVSFWMDRLKRLGVAIEEGPVSRNGAEGPMTSVYFRDPDQNLIEVSHYEHEHD
jgi:catechol 2,3-dioxygenase-like lactoylglutathione lyase family enzyme